MADDFTIDPSEFQFGEGPTYTGGGDFNFYNDSAPSNMDWGQFFGGLGTSFGGSPLDTSLPILPYGYAPNAPTFEPLRDNPGLFQSIWKSIFGKAGASPSGIAGALIPAAGVASGIGGIIQNLTQGRPVTTQQLRSTVQESPQQAQLTAQTLSALQNLQGLAQNRELQNAVSSLASGNLPISQNLVDQVTKAFGATAGGVAQRSIENARERGFSGGTELLGGAGSPQYSQSLAQLQSDVSQALVNLALGLPTAAGNIQSGLVSNAAIPIQQSLGLLGQMQQFAGLQGGRDMTMLGPRPTLLSALGPLSQLAGGLGQMGASRSMFQPQQGPSLSGVDS